jgi:hypothetical protein
MKRRLAFGVWRSAFGVSAATLPLGGGTFRCPHREAVSGLSPGWSVTEPWGRRFNRDVP